MRIYKKPYKPDYMKCLARELRKNPTEAERILWSALKQKNFFGYRFRRQAPFGRYIFDFFCPQKHFAIEIDGISHSDKYTYDKNRDDYTQSCNITVLRIPDKQVKRELFTVLKLIKKEIELA